MVRCVASEKAVYNSDCHGEYSAVQFTAFTVKLYPCQVILYQKLYPTAADPGFAKGGPWQAWSLSL